MVGNGFGGPGFETRSVRILVFLAAVVSFVVELLVAQRPGTGNPGRAMIQLPASRSFLGSHTVHSSNLKRLPCSCWQVPVWFWGLLRVVVKGVRCEGAQVILLWNFQGCLFG